MQIHLSNPLNPFQQCVERDKFLHLVGSGAEPQPPTILVHF